MSWNKKNVHPGKIVTTSHEVEVMVLDVDEQKRRISLGLKQCGDNPWDGFVENHAAGSAVPSGRWMRKRGGRMWRSRCAAPSSARAQFWRGWWSVDAAAS